LIGITERYLRHSSDRGNCEFTGVHCQNQANGKSACHPWTTRNHWSVDPSTAIDESNHSEPNWRRSFPSSLSRFPATQRTQATPLASDIHPHPILVLEEASIPRGTLVIESLAHSSFAYCTVIERNPEIVVGCAGQSTRVEQFRSSDRTLHCSVFERCTSGRI